MRPAHSEQLPGEVFVGNLWAADFPRVGWRTKRLGRTSLDARGKPIPNMRPAFAARTEIDAAGVPIPDAGPIDHRW